MEEGTSEDSFGNKEGLELLDYERSTLAKTLPASVLFVVASGLGIERLFLEHLILYSDRRLLALVLNTNEHDESFFISKLKEQEVDSEPKIINSEVSIKDRQSIYLEGGVQFCSSRVLLVDLLQNRLPIDRIAAIFVYRAHQTLNSFQDSFILRLYREKKPDGMVKAFTDVPNTLSSLGQLQRVVDRLYVRHVELMPRFSSLIEGELNRHQLRTAIFSVDVPIPLRRIHRTLMDFVKVCIRDLRTSSTVGKQADDEEMVHVPWAATQLERRLRERRGHLSDKQQRLLNDAASLREILQMSENMDAATVLSKLNMLKSDRTVLEEHSGWLISPSFNRIMEDLLAIAGIQNGKGDIKKFQVPAKWNVLIEVIKEIKDIPLDKKEYSECPPSVIVLTSSEDLTRQVSDVIRYGVNKMKWLTWRQLGHKNNQEQPDDEPLWDPDNISQLMRSSLDAESKSEVIANVQKSQKTTARAAQKRRKHAAELGGPSSDSRVQTNLIQFGILQYKRRKSGNEESVSAAGGSKDEWDVKREVEEVEEDEEGVKTIGDLDTELIVCTSRERERYTLLKLLEQKKPNAIVLYTMSLQTLRQIEIYRSTHPRRHLQVYWLQYKESTEESRYLESINRETMSFEMLIREQGTLMIAREFNVDREEAPRLKTSTRDGGGIGRKELDPRDQIEEQETDRPKIIVDMREFNSELPTILYTKGYDVVATTIEIGDYILSTDIAIERKALDDLTQSLQSGRVFKQIEQMLEHYDCTVLLIESNRKFETRIVNGGPFQGELSRHCRDIRSLFCSLIRANPKMRCVWTVSPANSAEFFSELKLNAPEPDVDRAISLKADQVEASQEEASSSSSQPKKVKKWKPNPTIVRTLTQNFGLKTAEVHNLLANSPMNPMRLVTLAGRITCYQQPFTSFITKHSKRNYVKMAAAEESVVSRNEMHRFMVECMTTAGASESHATQLAQVLLEGDVRGHYSHGLNRLDMYVRDVQQKVCKGDGQPIILKERAGTAWVDGNNLLGPVVGNFCMDLAIKKAKDAGIGWVVAKGSNHYGIAGWYALRAMKAGMLGMSMTNTSPISYPTRSSVPALGTNPISLAAPGTNDDAFVLDMASTTVAIGKVELAARKENPVPLTWGVGAGGTETNDPNAVLNGGGLLPLGGTEISGGYKGYGLSSMIEIFCGVLAGAHWGPNVRKWMSTSSEADLGQCFVAIDPEAFAPGFAERLQDFMQTMRNLPTTDASKPVEVAGDMERRHEQLVEQLGGIPYHKKQITFVNELAGKLNVKPVELIQ